MTERELESLVIDLLKELGFSSIQSFHGSMDYGYDIQATYPSKSLTGDIVLQRWLITLKASSRIAAQHLASALAFIPVKQADKALFITTGNLTLSAKEYIAKFAKEFQGKFEIWDRDQLVNLITRFPAIQQKYSPIIAEIPLSLTKVETTKQQELINRVRNCPLGQEGWRSFEEITLQILHDVLVPPLKPAKEQARTLEGLERRDALFPLRGVKEEGWQDIRQEFDANFLLCEFKNYAEEFSKGEVNQTRNYLKKTIGRLGIIFSRKGGDRGAKRMRNSIYSEEGKVILFFDERHLIELLKLKSAHQNPLDLIQDAIDDFYISHE